ncbi:MAG: hypothetical protein QXQ46_06890 [Thermoplasmatales archaeon]
MVFNPHSFATYSGGWFGIIRGVTGTMIGLFFFIWLIIWIFRFAGLSSKG